MRLERESLREHSGFASGFFLEETSQMGWASQAGQERVGICAQDSGQGEDVEKGNIALSAFH